MIKFRCQQCGKKIGMPDDTAGRRVKCPNCGEVETVPQEAVAVTTAPVVETMQDSPLLDMLDSLHMAGEEGDATDALLTGPGGRRCPECNAGMGANAVLCINCGHHLELEMNARELAPSLPTMNSHTTSLAHDDRPAPRSRGGSLGGLLSSLIAGSVAAAIGAAIWTGIVYATGYEIGWVAWGIGVFVGVGVAAGNSGGGLPGATIASGLAIASLVAAKVMIVQIALPAITTAEVVKDQAWLEVAVAVQMAKAGEISDSEDAAMLSDDDAMLPYDWEPSGEVTQRMQAMSQQEKVQAAREMAAIDLGRLSSEEKFKLLLSPWDLLWLVLAVGSAGKLGYAGELTMG